MFDDYFPCQKDNCTLEHVRNWFNLFVDVYNSMIIFAVNRAVKICHNIYIAEEFSTHICQKIAIVMFDTDGNRWGLYDRNLPFPLSLLPKLTDEHLHDNEKDDNRRRLDRTRHSNRFILKLRRNRERKMTAGKSVVLTADRSLMTNYRGNFLYGFIACGPYELVPEFVFDKLFCPSVETNQSTGEVKVAQCGLRRIESALLKEYKT